MHYWQKVRVTSWFYEGMEGTIQEYYNWNCWLFGWEPMNPYTTYTLVLTDWYITKWIDESSLELIK